MRRPHAHPALLRRPSELLGVLLLLVSSPSMFPSCVRPGSVPGAASPAAAPSSSSAAASVSASSVDTLRAAAAVAKRRIGTAFDSGRLADPTFRELAARHFDSLTAENDMKWSGVEPQPGAFSFGAGDALVAFARKNGMRVRGHTLVWHQQLAPWVKDLTGEGLRAAMLRHVDGVVSHWRGQIAQWDVVNEALADGPGALRADSPFAALGPTYLDEAFRAAHKADPEAQLFYNDYEIEGEGSPKSESAFAVVKRMKDAGVPIHGVGLQMHVDPRRWPTADRIRSNIERYAALGLFVEITEMDVPVGEIRGSLEQKLERQRAITADILGACLAVERCSGVTFWGLSDRHTWLNDPKWGKLRGTLPHLPLPFDADYRPKPMFGAIRDTFAKR